MKLSQTELFEHLKTTLEKMGATYQEHSFRATTIPVKSGLCVVRGELCFIMDKRRKLREKNRILGRALARMDLDTVHIPPAVREFISGDAS
ncbi:hypothetical protein [Desulfoluna butyratoxydans]|uniref:Uncharacterized protein n=1 Tax=Desulfoluna butyratoxydans TaxID=231438 RepID=A0A4U8YR03_9BACT|nr:hypothetical protein [Desulfoluna butyratoxydans]VFQ46706.1 hypothetical protein MSL71_43760 [Desulfoluna butyratoxydans]